MNQTRGDYGRIRGPIGHVGDGIARNGHTSWSIIIYSIDFLFHFCRWRNQINAVGCCFAAYLIVINCSCSAAHAGNSCKKMTFCVV